MIEVSADGVETLVKLRGELDLSTAAHLGEELREVGYNEGLRLVIDLAEVQFIDSTGVGALVSQLTRVRRAGGEMVLRSPVPSVRRTIELVGLDRAVPVM